MESPRGFLAYLWGLLLFFPVFAGLLVLGIVKAIIICPFVFLVIGVGNSAVIVGLWPIHVVWTFFCIAKTQKFGILLKCLLCLSLPAPLLLGPVIGIVGSFLTGLGYGLCSPLMATFEAVGEGVTNKIFKCFVGGTWSSISGSCTIVCDFADVCNHSYFSLMDELLESKSEMPLEIKLLQIPRCALVGILGVAVDVPVITVLTVYKAPVMLFKGWHRLGQDLIGRAGPFLETVCVPFAGLSILLWPLLVGLSAAAGIISSFFLGIYAAVVAYQENSVKMGLLFIVSAISLFDEYSNDLLYLREGSWFPRPWYRKTERVGSGWVRSTPFLEHEAAGRKHPPVKTPSMKMQELKAVQIWDNLFKACEYFGKELIGDGAIVNSDLEEWQHSKNKIINIGLPAYAFLQCFLRSIKSGSTGFLMRDNIELTSVNRPEGRVFDWFFDPMSVMKEQLKAANFLETEEAYLYKLTLYCQHAERLEAWHNGGMPPDNEMRRAQLEAMSRRLQGFGLTLSRMPTFRRRFHEVVNNLLQEALRRSKHRENGNEIEAV